MPRSVRLEYAGAVYHVMCRGDHQEAIFLDRRDRALFLETLAECCQRTGFQIHGYVLMTNHYHLLLETPEANLVDGMRWFQATYTARFNARHRKRGHLFQGRYKAIPLEADKSEYFRRLSDYIHLNPARAGLVDPTKADVERYEWSSASLFVAAQSLPPWLVRRRAFESLDLPNEGKQSRLRFKRLLRMKARELRTSGKNIAEEWRDLRRGWYVGGPDFRDHLENLADRVVSGKRRSSYRPEGLQRHDELAAAQLLEQALTCLGLSKQQVRALKKNDARKQAIAWLLKTRTAVLSSWIQAQLDMGDASNIRRAVMRYRNPTTPTHQRLYNKLLHICRD